MMKRLFCVKDKKGKRIIPKMGDDWWGDRSYTKISSEGYFESKMDAKSFRDYLGSYPNYCISRGPDHIGLHGTPGPSQMRRQPPVPYNQYR